ncbi:phosphate signaling complex protein PhoU [Magnetofaba australis]|uniref:Phosphate-specific transport system accessory protein PhoU n=1 Tax=Magnetofaba australis IT-1 TaxID=1434232 RepID=A0A1Y2JZC6_9PROT|nr:phosphate signaling complex protein PhoU [Magnetofaba australis]OSM00248.1 putative phosphate uptake regulator PhoU [Magnetofaba australis IT-1]
MNAPIAQHIVTSYEEELAGLDESIRQMIQRTEHQLELSLKALEKGDLSQAKEAIDLDSLTDSHQMSLDGQGVRMIALRQPMGRDLRAVISTLRNAPQLERIGDYAANIAERVETLARLEHSFNLEQLLQMGAMLIKAIAKLREAHESEDVNAAISVWSGDEEVDELHNGIFSSLLAHMAAHPEQADSSAHLVCIARDMERIGDHLTDVAENIYYRVTGEVVRETRPKGDRTKSITLA